MIEITPRQLQMVRDLELLQNTRGRTINTRVVYELWPLMYGVKKRPNGCNACLRADLNKFITDFKKLEQEGNVTILTDSQENNK